MNKLRDLRSFFFAKIYVTLGVQLKMKYRGTKYQTSGL